MITTLHIHYFIYALVPVDKVRICSIKRQQVIRLDESRRYFVQQKCDCSTKLELSESRSLLPTTIAKRGIQALELDARISRGKLPVHGGHVVVAILLPALHLLT